MRSCSASPQTLGPGLATKWCRYTARSRVSRVRWYSSKPTPWTEEQATRVCIMGFGSTCQMLAFGFAKVERPPPIKFLVENNKKVKQLHTNNGEIKLIRDGVVETAWGFEVENTISSDSYVAGAKEFASERHVQLRTLVLETHQKYSRDVELSEDAMDWRFDGLVSQRLKKPVKFLGDPSKVTHPLDPTLRIADSKVDLVSQPSLKVVEKEEAVNNEPIRQLIAALEPQYLSAALNQIKHRLRRDSTIVFIQKGMLIQEMVNKEVFPDPATRPNYVIGTFTHRTQSNAEQTVLSDPIDDIMEQYVFDEKHEIRPNGLLLRSESEAILTISPVVKFHDESEKVYKERQKNAIYIMDLMLSAKTWLNTRLLDSEGHRRQRFKAVAYTSVVHPMTIMFNCYNRGVLSSKPEVRHVFQELLKEAAAVLSYDDPKLNLETLSTYIGEQILNGADNLSPMLVRLARGKETAIEWGTGAIVKRGMELVSQGVPFPKMHLDILNFVHHKARVVLNEIQDRLDTKQRWRDEINQQQQAELKKRRTAGAQLPSKEDLRLERMLLFKERRELRNDYGQRERRALERMRLNPPQASARDFTTPNIALLGNAELKLDKDRWETDPRVARLGNAVSKEDKDRWETGPMKLMRQARERAEKRRVEALKAVQEGAANADVEEGEKEGEKASL